MENEREVIFVYQVVKHNLVYYKKRLDFYLKTCKTPISDLIVLIDRKYNPGFSQSLFAGWAKKVHVIDYNEFIRPYVDFDKRCFLDPAIERLDAWIANKFDNPEVLYSYYFKFHPLTKIIFDRFEKKFTDPIFVQVEDGLLDYLEHENPDDFLASNPYEGSRLEKSIYGNFFSLGAPDIPKSRFFYALFYPDLIQSESQTCVSVEKFFDFYGNVDFSLSIKDSVIVDPYTINDLDRFIKYWETYLKSDYPNLLINPRRFADTYHEVEVVPLLNILRGLDSCAVAPANDLSREFVEFLQVNGFKNFQVFDIDDQKDFVVPLKGYQYLKGCNPEHVFVLSPRYSKEIVDTISKLGVCQSRVTQLCKKDLLCADMVPESMACPKQEKVKIPISDDCTLESIQEKYEGFSFFNAIVPTELLPLNNCVHVSTCSSVLYRLPKVNSTVKTLSLFFRNEVSHKLWEGELLWTKSKIESLELVLEKMDVPMLKFSI